MLHEHMYSARLDPWFHAAFLGILISFAPAVAPAAEVRLLSLAAERSSVTTTGGTSLGPMTPDGRYLVLNSWASNLIPGQDDTNGTFDVFLLDRLLGTTTLVSHRPGEPLRTTAIGSSGQGVSPDGRYVLLAEGGAFGRLGLYDTVTATTTALPPDLEAGRGSLWSADGRLVALQQRRRTAQGLVLYDLETGTTQLVTHVAGDPGGLAAGLHFAAALTPDGRYLLYTSSADDLVPGQVDGAASWDVFLFDRSTGHTELVSAARSQPTVALGGNASGLSSNGRWIAWVGSPSAAGFSSELPAQVFLYDRVLGQQHLVSRAAEGPARPSDGAATGALVSPNGQFVLFASRATDLVPGQLDSAATVDVFLHDRRAGTIRLVSSAAGSSSRTAAGDSEPLAISPDGRFATFRSTGTDLVTGVTDAGTSWDVFRFDRGLARNELVSHSVEDPWRTGAAGIGDVRVAAQGRRVVFTSASSDLVPGPDLNRADDAFAWSEGPVALLSGAAFAVRTTPEDGAGSPRMTPSGSHVAFNAAGSNLLPGGAPETGTYLHHRDTGQLETLPTGGVVAIEPDAERVLLTSTLTLPGTPPGFFLNAVVHDRTHGQTTIVSHAAGSPSTAANDRSFALALSEDGRFVLFSSAATNLVAGQADTPGTENLFLYDRQTGTPTLVDHAAASSGQTGNGWTSVDRVAMTPDGRFVLFSSVAADLVAGSDLPGSVDVFLFDRTTGAVELVSHAPGEPTTAAGGSEAGELSADARWIAFHHYETELGYQINMLDRTTGQIRRITRDFDGGDRPASKSSYLVAMTPDGRFLLLESEAPLTDADLPWRGQTYLYDRLLDTFELISHRAGAPKKGSASLSLPIDLTPDGRFVLFEAYSDDVVGLEGTPWGLDYFRYDRTTRQARLISHRPGEPDGGSNATEPLFASGGASLSNDGRTITFVSQANNLYPHDFNHRVTFPGEDGRLPDVFLFVETVERAKSRQ
jgi:Tol biopolymer transport system component